MANTKRGPQPPAPWSSRYGSSRSTLLDGTSRWRGDPLGDYERSSRAKPEAVVERRKKVK